MLIVRLDNQVSLDFYDNDPPIASQHYAFLLGDDDFDRAFARLQAASSRGGPIRASSGPGRSMSMAEGGGCISMTRTGICWRSSPANDAISLSALHQEGACRNPFSQLLAVAEGG